MSRLVEIRRNALPVLGRVGVMLAGAIWLGGVTFYTGVVITTAHDVLGSHRAVGFITREVTGRINGIGTATLVVLLVNLVANRSRTPWCSRVLWPTWVAMVATQATLVALHPALDRLLDPAARQVLDVDRFDRLHRLYVVLTTLQLGLGGLYLIAAVARMANA